MSLSKASPPKVSGCLGKATLILLLALGSGVLGWFMGKFWLQQLMGQSIPPEATSPVQPSSSTTAQSPFSAEEIKLKSTLRDRQREMGIDRTYFHRLMDQLVAIETLETSEKTTSTSNSTDTHRDRLALQTLDHLSTLSPEALTRLGRYDESQRNRAKRAANQLNLSSRALFDLVDARLFQQFPYLANQSLTDTPAEQIRDAVVFDTLQLLSQGDQYERLAFEEGERSLSRSGTISPGKGKAMVIALTAEHFFKLSLDADSRIQLSIYTPTGTMPMLRNSGDREWSGKLSETGFYEIVITSRATTTLPYQLNIETKD
jgi:serine/threonine-protein kinase